MLQQKKPPEHKDYLKSIKVKRRDLKMRPKNQLIQNHLSIILMPYLNLKLINQLYNHLNHKRNTSPHQVLFLKLKKENKHHPLINYLILKKLNYLFYVNLNLLMLNKQPSPIKLSNLLDNGKQLVLMLEDYIMLCHF